MIKEKQEFQLGDTVYMLDEDYRFFEDTIYRIELHDGKFYYTCECDFKNSDIGDWVFESEMHRELYMETMFGI